MRIQSFVQTPFVTHDDLNKISVSVADWDNCNPYFTEIFINGEKVFEKRYFAREFSAEIPCCTRNSTCTVKITPFEDLPVERSYEITPPKKWEIPLLYSSHEDLGYCAYIDKLHRECYDYLKVAMELCEKHDGFKYMIEHYWWLDAFDTYATEEEKEQLRRLFEQKKIDLNSIHSGVHTNVQNAEALVREMYFGCRDAKKKYGISPEIAFYVDLSGFSWSCVDAFADMGIKYMAAFINPYRNCKEDKGFPPIFWLKSKNGEKRVLFWHQWSYRPLGLFDIWCDTLRQYPEGEFFFDETKALKTEKWFTEKLCRVSHYGYDILPISFYDDRELPTSMLITVCEEMNKRYKYPHFKMEIPSVFMREIEEKYGDILPEFSGEINDQWGFSTVFSPVLTAKRRKISRLMYNAEMKSCIDMVTKSALYDNDVFTKAVWNMGCFDEHCIASSSKHPFNMHKYNIDKVKIEPVETSLADMEKLEDSLFGGADGNKMSVTNLIPQGGEFSLKCSAAISVPIGYAHQILPDGSCITEPLSFECAEVKSFDAELPYDKSVEIFTSCFETDFYKVSLNHESKRLTGILDKISGKELLDKDAEFDLGQFIYINCENGYAPYTGIELAKNKSLKIYDGKIAFCIIINALEEQSGAEV
ncbi:MAG: hypothetical protein IJZ20_03025, partial [Clostridia bacterium]|nr:hypothetical protein [Clostridia bacterium]